MLVLSFKLCALAPTDTGSVLQQSIKIWDLESKSIVEELKVDPKAEAEKSEGDGASNKKKVIYRTSLNLSADGSTLFSGYTDGVVRVWGIGRY
ncbi:hypothetical protein SLA2020_331670 [Shorea laevis]